MRTRQGPTAAQVGSAVLLLATGAFLLAAGAVGIAYRGRIGTRLAVHGQVVAAGAALVGLCGLAAVFGGYLVSSRSAT